VTSSRRCGRWRPHSKAFPTIAREFARVIEAFNLLLDPAGIDALERPASPVPGARQRPADPALTLDGIDELFPTLQRRTPAPVARMTPHPVEPPYSHCDVAIVGAGAAGLATAIFASRANAALSIVLLEGARKPGAKILISGGGRCNVTNSVVTASDFWGGPSTIVRRVLRAFPVADTVAFFRELGVALHEEADGKLFPDSNRARDVLDALLRGAESAGARLVADCRVQSIATRPGGFRLTTTRGDLTAGAVVLATGGRSVPKTGSDGAGYGFAERLGHSIVPVTPGLAPLRLADSPGIHRWLAGVSHEAELTLWTNGSAGPRQRGQLLWTHFGVSGPVALNLSRHWARARLEGQEAAVTLNFLPGVRFETAEERLVQTSLERPRTSLRSALAEPLPASTALALVDSLKLDPDLKLAHLTRDARRRLAHALTAWPLPVTDTRGFGYAEVTAGGVRLTEIDPGTMRSRRCPGVYLVGEILDVDGRLGGFNFQWAWSSAFVAAKSVVSR
jgi:predicted Rossmann fold flavoprotein